MEQSIYLSIYVCVCVCGNPGNGVANSPKTWSSIYLKGSVQFVIDYDQPTYNVRTMNSIPYLA